MKLHDFDFTNKKIPVSQTKTDENREISIDKYLAGVFKIIEKDREKLFKDRSGNQLRSIKHPFKRALAEAEIKDFRFHDIHHTFSSYLAMYSGDETTSAELLGYKNVS